MLRRASLIAVATAAAIATGGCGGNTLKTADDFARYVDDVVRGKSAYGVEAAEDAETVVVVGLSEASALERFQQVVDDSPDVACLVAKGVKDLKQPTTILVEAAGQNLPVDETQSALDALSDMSIFTVASVADTACEIADAGI